MCLVPACSSEAGGGGRGSPTRACRCGRGFVVTRYIGPRALWALPNDSLPPFNCLLCWHARSPKELHPRAWLWCAARSRRRLRCGLVARARVCEGVSRRAPRRRGETGPGCGLSDETWGSRWCSSLPCAATRLEPKAGGLGFGGGAGGCFCRPRMHDTLRGHSLRETTLSLSLSTSLPGSLLAMMMLKPRVAPVKKRLPATVTGLMLRPKACSL